MKSCPACAEQIQDEARVCRFCGTQLDSTLRPQQPAAPMRVDGLSSGEWWLYGILFLVLPCLNVILSSVLYYSWRGTQPRKAKQINGLGWAIFGIQILIRVMLGVLGVFATRM